MLVVATPSMAIQIIHARNIVIPVMLLENEYMEISVLLICRNEIGPQYICRGM